MPHLSIVEVVLRRVQEHERQQHQPGHLEDAQQPPPRHDPDREERQENAAGEAADLLPDLHAR